MAYENFKEDFDNLWAKLDKLLISENLKLNPADVYDTCYGILDSWLHERIDLHEPVPQEIIQETQVKWFSQYICKLYWDSAIKFFNAGAHFSATTLLIHGWNKLAERQIITGHRIYRASIAFNLAQLAYLQNDVGAAIWWALHTQADDHMGGDSKGGGGRHMLKSVLGASQKALDALSSIGDKSLNITQAQNNWKMPDSFAEHVVVTFALEKRALGYILGNNSITLEYPLSGAYYTALLSEVKVVEDEDDKLTNKNKGDALEKLAAYLLMLIPGWLPLPKVEDEKKTTEIDLVVRNIYPNNNLMADVFGRHFVVECKNWKKPVGSRDVGYFLNKIRQSHASFGIIFSKQGITGDNEEEKSAKELTRRAFHEDKSVCIVISYEDLKRIESGETTFRSLLLELFEEFRFGHPKNKLS